MRTIATPNHTVYLDEEDYATLLRRFDLRREHDGAINEPCLCKRYAKVCKACPLDRPRVMITGCVKLIHDLNLHPRHASLFADYISIYYGGKKEIRAIYRYLRSLPKEGEDK